jgi:2-C-methyl-D-erythritol 2,4-cyclodiphosphate synthase
MSNAIATRPRIGVGFDIHALEPGDHVVLGGVRIPHNQGIKAHSDGDVAIHALCDALLGALALGDIGHYFPPTDVRWRGVDSRELLRQCRRLLIQHGYEVGNADISVIAEAPKLAPHVALMRTRLAEDLGISEDNISVKATTNEKLDAIGRAEGIAAHAVVMLFPKEAA